MNIYISGQISSIEATALKMFNEAEIKLQKAGTIFNPFKFDHKPNSTWYDYMNVCLKELNKCDIIVLLPTWEKSRGAIIEATVGVFKKMKVIEYVDYLYILDNKETAEISKYLLSKNIKERVHRNLMNIMWDEDTILYKEIIKFLML